MDEIGAVSIISPNFHPFPSPFPAQSRALPIASLCDRHNPAALIFLSISIDCYQLGKQQSVHHTLPKHNVRSEHNARAVH